MKRPLVVGNWKMHGTRAECEKLAKAITRKVRSSPPRAQVVLAPPFLSIQSVKKITAGSRVLVAAQNCHWQNHGAFTGETSVAMIRDVGCSYVILGHSERRHLLHETDGEIAQKLAATTAQNLKSILCVGETLAQRQAGQTAQVITRQLRIALKGLVKSAIDKLEIAYEPVWAIGTGHNASLEQICQVHQKIRTVLKSKFGVKGSEIRVLYGGSVKPENAAGLANTQEVNGLLIGGASLNAETFLTIVNNYN